MVDAKVEEGIDSLAVLVVLPEPEVVPVSALGPVTLNRGD